MQGGSTVMTGGGTLTLTAASRPFSGVSGGTGTVALVGGNVRFSAAGQVALDVRLNAASQGITQVFDGVIGGAAGGIGLTGNQQASAVVRFAGTAANTFTGLVTWSKSTLELGKSAGAAAIPGDLLVTGGTVRWLADAQVADTATVTITGGQLDLNGCREHARHLYFGAVKQAEGTWGGTGSGADNIEPTYFAAGSGLLTVGPAYDTGTMFKFR
jgi:hypothetical protein